MSLSPYLVSKMVCSETKHKALRQLKEESRVHTSKWFEENPEELKKVEESFQFVTGLPFADNRTSIINGMADHYAEKVYSYERDPDEYLNFLSSLEAPKDEIEKIKETLEHQVVLCFGGHFLGNDILPPLLGNLGVPSTTFNRYKSETAERIFFDQDFLLEKLNLDLCNVDQGLFLKLVRLRNNPRLVFTALDSFDNWKLKRRSDTVNLFGKEMLLDTTPDRLVSALNAVVYFITLECVDAEKYSLRLKPIKPDANGRYAIPLINEWKKRVLAQPQQMYAWDDVPDLFEVQENFGLLYRNKT